MKTNIKKIGTLLALTPILFLAGCSTDTQNNGNSETIQLSASYVIEKVPDWDELSTVPLKEAGWNVEQQKNMHSINSGFTEPVNYYTTSKNDKCSVSYLTFANIADKELKTSDQYLTYSNPNIKSITQNPSAQIAKMDNSSIKDASTGKNIQILTTSYTQESADGSSKQENIIVGIRTFATPLANPYTMLGEQSSNASINPTIAITYSCKDQKLDKKLWESILKAATIKTN